MTLFQKDLLQYIRTYILTNGSSPSMREMSLVMKCGMGKLYHNLKNLKKRGKINWTRNLWRGVEVND